jgi:hypothetical protein
MFLDRILKEEQLSRKMQLRNTILYNYFAPEPFTTMLFPQIMPRASTNPF